MSVAYIKLSGTPRQMGQQFGEELREMCRAMTQTRLDLVAQAVGRLVPPRDLAWALDLAAASLPYLEQYSPAVYEEFSGIAEAAGLTPSELLIGNSWTDFKDLIEASAGAHNCTSLVIEGTLTAEGQTYLAQTWDMNVTAAPYVVIVHRCPAEGPQTLSFTTAGCLSLIGLNEEGICVGNTNLVPKDARPGVFYLALIHEALRRHTMAEACAAIIQAPRMSGHYYYLGDAQGNFLGIETTATAHAQMYAANGRFVHTNHYLAPELKHTGLTTPPGSNSLGRQQRCEALVENISLPASFQDITQMLSDHHGPYPICRHIAPQTEYATIGAVILCPARRHMWIVSGNPCSQSWQLFSL